MPNLGISKLIFNETTQVGGVGSAEYGLKLNALFFAAIIRHECGRDGTLPGPPRNNCLGMDSGSSSDKSYATTYNLFPAMMANLLYADYFMSDGKFYKNGGYTLEEFGKAYYSSNPNWASEVKSIMDDLYEKCDELGFTVNK